MDPIDPADELFEAIDWNILGRCDATRAAGR